MLACLSRRPGYQQITEIPCFDFLNQEHVLLTVPRSFGCNEQTIYRLQKCYRQPGSKNDKLLPEKPRITTPFEARIIVTSS